MSKVFTAAPKLIKMILNTMGDLAALMTPFTDDLIMMA